MFDCDEKTGLAEFCRSFALEAEMRSALVIDIRGNAGGHVSGLVLARLMQRPLAHDVPRHGAPTKWPAGAAPPGRAVLLIDEHTSSDGDMLAWAFRRLQLGKIVGRQTWGGVDGISQTHTLVDGSVVAQASERLQPLPARAGEEPAVLENHGVQPDIEMPFAPHAFGQDADPQLSCALQHALQQLAEDKDSGLLAPEAFLHIDDRYR